MDNTLPLDLSAVEASLEGASHWVLLLGGSTSAGAARARRVCEAFCGSSFVVWFDGFGVTDALDELESVTRIDFSKKDAPKWWKLATDPAASATRSRVRRRLRTVLRPYATWRALRPTLKSLTSQQQPDLIVYCDDVAVPLAWHAARIWPDSRLMAGVPQ